MSIEEKVKLVEGVFDQLDQQIAAFQNASSLHCKWGCGKCCYKADIEATLLEFLPFALFLHQQNQTEAWLNNLQETDSSICLILNPTQNGAGLCSQYKPRGLICRLFGYSARTTKYGKPELVTCHIIKTEQQENFVKAEAAIEQGLDVPVMSNFYMQLHSIDFELTREFFPINVAMRKAIETVLQYYAYR